MSTLCYLSVCCSEWSKRRDLALVCSSSNVRNIDIWRLGVVFRTTETSRFGAWLLFFVWSSKRDIEIWRLDRTIQKTSGCVGSRLPNDQFVCLFFEWPNLRANCWLPCCSSSIRLVIVPCCSSSIRLVIVSVILFEYSLTYNYSSNRRIFAYSNIRTEYNGSLTRVFVLNITLLRLLVYS